MTPAPAAKALPLVDMDWDDEPEDKTRAYEKDDANATLELPAPRPSPGALPPPSMPGALPPPSLPKPVALLPLPPANAPPIVATARSDRPPPSLSAPLPGPPVQSRRQAITIPPAPPSGPAIVAFPGPGRVPADMERTLLLQTVKAPSSKRLAIGGGIVAAVAVAAIALFSLQPKTGAIVIVGKSGGRELSSAEVFIDGKRACDALPCVARDVERGTRSVKVAAVGFEPGSSLVAVRAGEESPVTIELARARPDPSEAASTLRAKGGTGFKIAGPASIKLAIDGKEIGALPQEVRDAAPGEHKIRLYGSDRYRADERTLTVTEDEMRDLGTVKLAVVKGQATFALDTPGATVTLVAGSERRALKHFPVTLDLDPAKGWQIEASKVGFLDYQRQIAFEDGEAEKTFTITLAEKGRPAGSPPGPTSAPDDDKPAAAPKTSSDTGKATLNINAIPPSSCVLDGRPLGTTPKVGVSVAAGSHTVLFVHPTAGRKTVTVSVKAGETRSVSARLSH